MIREVRKYVGMSQGRMGDFLGGLEQSTISKWETKDRTENYTPDQLRKLNKLVKFNSSDEMTILNFLGD